MGNTHEVQLQFLDCLLGVRMRHIDVVPTMAMAVKGMLDAKDSRRHKDFKEHVHYTLDRLYLNRISTHMLISNYQALHEKAMRGMSEYGWAGTDGGRSGMLGTIDPQCNIMEVVREAFNAASLICKREYLHSPDLNLQGFENKGQDSILLEQDSIQLAYVPTHLYHIFFELFKNAMRASCDVSVDKSLQKLPYIKSVSTRPRMMSSSLSLTWVVASLALSSSMFLTTSSAQVIK